MAPLAVFGAVSLAFWVMLLIPLSDSYRCTLSSVTSGYSTCVHHSEEQPCTTTRNVPAGNSMLSTIFCAC